MSDYINSKQDEIRIALIKKAKSGKSTYYSELMENFHISRRWIGKILFCVADCCHKNNEPILTALVEHINGGIGDGYIKVVNAYGADINYKKEQEECFCYWKNKDIPV